MINGKKNQSKLDELSVYFNVLLIVDFFNEKISPKASIYISGHNRCGEKKSILHGFNA
jgi:hypothetical protein